MELSQKEISHFQQKIFSWYEVHKRELPWRKMPKGILLQERAYRILISEIMSQQTQIDRVIPKYEAWLERFPSVQDLAQASVADVLAYWSGLGYNRRALNLKRTAEIIVKEYGGVFTQNEKQLLALPGIGPYTARAILCFAFNQQIAVIDTNVRKVILVTFSEVNDTPKDIQRAAEQLLPVGRAGEWNQALMDYASAVLKKEKIPIPKQSTFVGSHRYYRGLILKTLLTKKQVAIKDLGTLIKKGYVPSEDQWLQKLVKELEGEGFIFVENNIIQLSP